MNNPGVKDLGDKIITGAMSGEVITSAPDSTGATQAYVSSLEGMLSCGIEIRFIYGSSGTTCKIYVQTSLDQGTTWSDVICMACTTASKTRLFNLSGLTPKSATTPADGVLTDDTDVDGIVGDRFRVKVVSTGTYAGNTQVSVRLVAR
jgi:hypothetical protein